MACCSHLVRIICLSSADLSMNYAIEFANLSWSCNTTTWQVIISLQEVSPLNLDFCRIWHILIYVSVWVVVTTLFELYVYCLIVLNYYPSQWHRRKQSIDRNGPCCSYKSDNLGKIGNLSFKWVDLQPSKYRFCSLRRIGSHFVMSLNLVDGNTGLSFDGYDADICEPDS